MIGDDEKVRRLFNIFCRRQEFLARPRNILRERFVYTGAARNAAVLGEILKKTPRWQPRGRDTQSFRPLVQEEKVSSPGRLLARRARVNSIWPTPADLKAGEYRLQIDGNKATVQKGKLVVAESEGRWEDRSSKSAYDSVLVGEGGQVKEVRFAGQTRVFVFSE